MLLIAGSAAYRRAEAKPIYRRDALLEANMRFLADRELEAKRVTLKTDKPDLLWRGTAAGGIRTDAASGDLKKVVEGMLSNFPPK